MTYKIPTSPINSYRLVLELDKPQERLDRILLKALKEQNDCKILAGSSKSSLKKMFSQKRILIKGQNARPTSSINSGVTTIDILR